MKKTKESKVYFSINPKPRMLFEVEQITVVDGKVVNTKKADPTYLQIVIGNIYKDTVSKVNNDA